MLKEDLHSYGLDWVKDHCDDIESFTNPLHTPYARTDLRNYYQTLRDLWSDFKIHADKYGYTFFLNAPPDKYLKAGRIAAYMERYWENEINENYGERGEPDIGLQAFALVPESWFKDMLQVKCDDCKSIFQPILTTITKKGGFRCKCKNGAAEFWFLEYDYKEEVGK